MSLAAIEVGGTAIGAGGTGSASDGAISKLSATGQGKGQPGPQAETFASRWQAFLHSLGMAPSGLALHQGTGEEELDPQPTENLTGELDPIQARLTAPGAADLPWQQKAGLQDGSLEGSPRIRTAGVPQADSTLGSQTAAHAQRTAYVDRAEIGNVQPAGGHAVDKSKGFE